MKKLALLGIVLVLLTSLAYASDWEWVSVGDLKVGDMLMDKDGNEIVIETIDSVYDPEGVMVYDLEVANFHYYFAEDVLVHNSVAARLQRARAPAQKTVYIDPGDGGEPITLTWQDGGKWLSNGGVVYNQLQNGKFRTVSGGITYDIPQATLSTRGGNALTWNKDAQNWKIGKTDYYLTNAGALVDAEGNAVTSTGGYALPPEAARKAAVLEAQNAVEANIVIKLTTGKNHYTPEEAARLAEEITSTHGYGAEAVLVPGKDGAAGYIVLNTGENHDQAIVRIGSYTGRLTANTNQAAIAFINTHKNALEANLEPTNFIDSRGNMLYKDSSDRMHSIQNGGSFDVYDGYISLPDGGAVGTTKVNLIYANNNGVKGDLTWVQYQYPSGNGPEYLSAENYNFLNAHGVNNLDKIDGDRQTLINGIGGYEFEGENGKIIRVANSGPFRLGYDPHESLINPAQGQYRDLIQPVWVFDGEILRDAEGNFRTPSTEEAKKATQAYATTRRGGVRGETYVTSDNYIGDDGQVISMLTEYGDKGEPTAVYAHESKDTTSKPKDTLSKTMQKFQTGVQDRLDFERTFTQFKGLSGFSSLLFDDEDLAQWRENIDEAFGKYMQMDYWQSLFCESQIDKLPSNTMLISLPNGLFATLGHAEAERGAGVPSADGTYTEYLYKISWGVRWPESQEATETPQDNIKFNVILYTSTGVAVPLYKAQWELEPGEEESATGTDMVVKYSPNVYTKICLQFNQAIKQPGADKDPIDRICNSIPALEGTPTTIAQATPASSSSSSSSSSGSAPAAAEGELSDF